eukprot:1188847-Pyramimonas_sp.AAC.1
MGADAPPQVPKNFKTLRRRPDARGPQLKTAPLLGPRSTFRANKNRSVHAIRDRLAPFARL